MLTLYQAEWCPFSSAVREVLTELGIDFAARQVEPWPEQRADLLRVTGSDRIPTLVTEDGRTFVGTRAIFGHLATLPAWKYAAAHRRRFDAHLPARESDAVGQLVERFSGEETGPGPDESLDAVEVVHVGERHRYELRLGDRRIGLAAYRRTGDTLALTHTEVAPECEGRGLGSRLAAAVLDDARAQGLTVVPLCPFMAWYISRNPSYQDLVAPDAATAS